MHMKKPVVKCLILLLLLLIIFAFVFNFIYINHHIYLRYSEALNLSGQEVENVRNLTRFPKLTRVDLRGTGLSDEDYAYLHDAMPGCTILWDPVFQGQLYSPESHSISISSLSSEEIPLLQNLPELKQIDARGCRDYEALMELRQHTEYELLYDVPLSHRSWDGKNNLLQLKNADYEELIEKLQFFADVKVVQLIGRLPAPEQMLRLSELYPDVQFQFKLNGSYVDLDTSTTDLNLTGTPLTPEQAAYIIECFPNLHSISVIHCGLTAQDILSLQQTFPRVFFLWETVIDETPIRTNQAVLDLTGCQLEDTEQIESILPCFPKADEVILCDCGLSSQQLDAMARRHPDIRFVWNVQLGPIRLRTDADFFAPVVTGDRVYDRDLEELRYCTNLVAIDLGHMSITHCEWAAFMPKLKYLIIADTNVSDISPLANHKELVFLEMFLTPVRDFSPLLSCTALEDLNLCYTIGNVEVLKDMTWLKRLWWCGNSIAVRDLKDALPDTEKNFYSGSSTGGSWRQGARYKEQRDILGMPYLVG